MHSEINKKILFFTGLLVVLTTPIDATIDDNQIESSEDYKFEDLYQDYDSS